MKKKWIHFMGLFAMLTFIVLIGGTLAYWRTEGVSKSVLELGKLKGSLVTRAEAAEGIYPGDTVQESIDVKNVGGLDMLVRLKVGVSWEDKQAGLSEDAVQIAYNHEKWLEGEEGYFYYKGILKAGEVTEQSLFDQFTIDAGISNEYQGENGDITVIMDCLQASGNAIKTWNVTYDELEIEPPKKKETQKTEVLFTKEKTFVFSSEGQDVFPSFKSLVPGEAVGQQVLLKNQANETVSMFLKPVLPDVPQEKKELLQKLVHEYAKITITNASGKQIYEGPIAFTETSGSKQGEVSLGSFEAGKEQLYSVTVQLDAAMENEFQGLASEINWSFIAQGEDGKTTASTLPKTGQEIRTLLLIMGMIAVLLIIPLSVRLHKRKKEMKNPQ